MLKASILAAARFVASTKANLGRFQRLQELQLHLVGLHEDNSFLGFGHAVPGMHNNIHSAAMLSSGRSLSVGES